MRERLRVGQVAAEAGVGVQTLHYYERRGLIAPPRRSPAGHRLYDAETIRIVRFVKRAQELGFPLRDIEALLRLRRAGTGRRDTIRRLAAARLEDIEVKRRRLTRMKRALQELLHSCACRDSELECPIIEALEDQESSQAGEEDA